MPKKFFYFLFPSFLAVLPFIVYALPLVPCGGPNKPCTVACFYVMLSNIMNFLLKDIAFPLAATALMVAGIMLVLGGSEKAITRGREILKFTLYGLFFAFAAWLIIDMILRGLLGADWYSVWNKFPDAC